MMPSDASALGILSLAALLLLCIVAIAACEKKLRGGKKRKAKLLAVAPIGVWEWFLYGKKGKRKGESSESHVAADGESASVEEEVGGCCPEAAPAAAPVPAALDRHDDHALVEESDDDESLLEEDSTVDDDEKEEGGHGRSPAAHEGWLARMWRKVSSAGSPVEKASSSDPSRV